MRRWLPILVLIPLCAPLSGCVKQLDVVLTNKTRHAVRAYMQFTSRGGMLREHLGTVDTGKTTTFKRAYARDSPNALVLQMVGAKEPIRTYRPEETEINYTTRSAWHVVVE